MGAAASGGRVALLMRRDNIASLILAIIAAPLIANRTQPRAEMFTTVLFAAFLSLLWRHYRTHGERSALWLLPVLMVAWVNLHLGFVAGLALCGAYVLLELLELPFPETRAAAVARLRRAWPWLGLTGVATLANPWGAHIFTALLRQARAQSLHTSWVVEWESVRPSWGSLRQALDLSDPQSSFWWLLAIAIVCAAIALWRKRFGAAVLLLAASYLAIQHVRLQALFACIAVVVGGAILKEPWEKRKSSTSAERSRSPNTKTRGWSRATPFVLAAVL